ncbi:MAG: mandelate racemase/muconate lactonizing enzyme family protein [Armatimonadetes bacterium]|nr:mandelate racemase/muconate lactonizing enzyme family protein [Armatimonadota bacterium]
MNLTIEHIERIAAEVPYREVPARNNIRELPQWTIFEICKVRLACGVVGFGETLQYYTWSTVSDDAVRRAMGRNAAEMMWDDSLGAGLQIALFDAVGKALDVPCWALMGRKYRDAAHISWWDIDMPAEDWVLECEEALRQGYTSFKTKGRPWFDLYHQCEVLSKVIPPHFQMDMDFNGMLLDTAHATRVLTEIERYPNVVIYESPIAQHDVAGNKFLRSQTRVPIAHHYGSPPIMTALKEDVCDGFVIGGGVSSVLQQGTICAAAEKPFWLQLVGSGITATWSIHLAAVLSHARWPAVNCHHMYVHQLINPPITVSNGLAAVPERPGLGVDLDEEALERFRLDGIPSRPYPTPGLLLAIRWPSGATSYYAHCQQYWHDFLRGRLPVFARGVTLERIPDDGSREWRELQERAQQGGVHVGVGAGRL